MKLKREASFLLTFNSKRPILPRYYLGFPSKPLQPKDRHGEGFQCLHPWMGEFWQIIPGKPLIYSGYKQLNTLTFLERRLEGFRGKRTKVIEKGVLAS